jgi:pyruvate/2-oxoacid:ferredoxin oxidoreductase alpha subunit
VRKVIVGNHAVSLGVKLARCEVISAYPITPQTQVVEMLSEMCSSGALDARFIKVESEHSAMAACVGASAAGVRTFTATSSHGLLYMHEMLHWAGGGRLPIVMANINRAIGPGWNIWVDQNDSLSQRDTGWLQLYCETNQEVLDTTIQAFKLAEAVDLPVMVVLDAFYLSHTSEPVDIPEQELVDGFLPKRVARHRWTGGAARVRRARAAGRLHGDAVGPAGGHGPGARRLRRHRRRVGPAHGPAVRRSGRVPRGGRGAAARDIGDHHVHVPRRDRRRRAAGERVGLVKVKMFRPFPTAMLREVLRSVPRVAVLDRNISPGHGGIFAEEIRSALYDVPPDDRPALFGYVLGLGGRDVTPAVIDDVIDRTRSAAAPEREDLWVGVKS